MEALDLLRATGTDTPLIMVSGTIDTALAVDCMKRGADDCLKKEDLGRVCEAVRDALRRCQRRRARAAAAAEAGWDKQLRLGLVERTAHMGVWHWSLADNRITWNEETYRLFGLDAGEFRVSLESFYERVHPDDRSGLQKCIDDAIREARMFEHEYRILRPDGQVRSIHIRGGVLLDENLSVREMLGTALDTTEARQAEAAQATLAAIVECSEDAILSEALDGTVTSWNKAAERIFGFSARDVIGRPLCELQPESRCAEAAALRAAVLRGERVGEFETERLRADGSSVWVSLSLSPIYDRQGRITGIARIARDITQRRQAAELLRESERCFEACFAQAAVGMAMTTLGATSCG